jgi:hypothetical protein
LLRSQQDLQSSFETFSGTMYSSRNTSGNNFLLCANLKIRNKLLVSIISSIKASWGWESPTKALSGA